MSDKENFWCKDECRHKIKVLGYDCCEFPRNIDFEYQSNGAIVLEADPNERFYFCIPKKKTG